MKTKVGVFFIFILLLAPLILQLIQAESYPGQESLPINPDEAQEKITQTQEQIKSEYLSQEWRKLFLNNTYIGPVIKVLDPISLALIGRQIIFTWAYLILLFVFIAIVIISYQAMKNIFNMSWWMALIAGLIIASLGSRFIPQKYLEFQFTLIWKLIILLVLILIAASFSVFWKVIKGRREKAEKEQATEERKSLHRITNAFMNMVRRK